MFTARRNTLFSLVGAGAALAAWLAAAGPIEKIGFLADDFEVGAILHARAEREPSALPRVASLFVERIGERFQVYRPLTILTVEADYAIFGADGGHHHLTSAVLWLLAALLSGGVAAELVRRTAMGRPEDPESPPDPLIAASVGAAAKRAAAFGFAFGLGSFAAVESLGWLVAREDLFVAVAGLGALRAELRRPLSACASLPWLLLGFFSKDTAIVLPPCLFVARLVLAREGVPLPRKAIAVPWIALAAYLGLRFAVFGEIGSKYLDRSYGEWLKDGNAPGHLLASLARLFAPMNDAWTGRFGIPFAARCVVPAFAAGIAVLAFADRGKRRGLLASVAVLLPFFVAAPALTSPMYEVSSTLQEGRTLALPSFALAALLGVLAGTATGDRRSAVRRTTAAAGLLLTAWSLTALWFHLGPFVAASAFTESVLSDFRAAPEGSRAVQLGGQTLGRPSTDFRHELVTFDGAYCVSGALTVALAPPFTVPAVPFSPTPAAALDPTSGTLLLQDPKRTAFFRAEPSADLPCGPGEPRFRLWSAPSSAPTAELVRLLPAEAAVEVFPRLADGNRLRLSLLTDLGRSEDFDLGPAAPPDAAPIKVPLDPTRLARLFGGGPRYVLWKTEALSADGAVRASQPPRVFAPR